MSFDGFLRIDGIDGESIDDQHKGWIEIVYFETNLKQKSSSTTSSVGGASSEKADFSDFVFLKQLDKASPKLALACAAGVHKEKVENQQEILL